MGKNYFNFLPSAEFFQLLIGCGKFSLDFHGGGGRQFVEGTISLTRSPITRLGPKAWPVGIELGPF